MCKATHTIVYYTLNVSEIKKSYQKKQQQLIVVFFNTESVNLSNLVFQNDILRSGDEC